MPIPTPTGVRTEQDLYVRLIDSVTKQVSPKFLGCSSPGPCLPLPCLSLTSLHPL